jgi:hypothetical protein
LVPEEIAAAALLGPAVSRPLNNIPCGPAAAAYTLKFSLFVPLSEVLRADAARSAVVFNIRHLREV